MSQSFGYILGIGMVLVNLVVTTQAAEDHNHMGTAEHGYMDAAADHGQIDTTDHGQIDAAILAVEQEDYMNAFKQFKALAEGGNVEAQHNLAILYKTGKGTMKDAKQAAKWFRKAADAGLSEAQFYLGRLYDKGEGVEQRFEYAAIWYIKAAQQGHALAQTNLGVLYANGEGVAQDLIQAYVWLSLGAAQGVTVALENRNAIDEYLSEEMRVKVKDIQRDYFQRYVAPFQAKLSNPHRLRKGPPADEPVVPTPMSDEN